MCLWVWRLHSPLGGKRSLGVKGLVGLDIVVEKSFSWREKIIFMEYGIHWKPYAFYCSMGGISEGMWKEKVWIALLRHVIIDFVMACFLEALLAYCNCKICCFIWIWNSPHWRAHLHPMLMILFVNNCVNFENNYVNFDWGCDGVIKKLDSW